MLPFCPCPHIYSDESTCHGSVCPAPFLITTHALTWFHWSLIELTCTSSSVITLSIKAPATVHSPSDLVNVSHYVDSTPAYTKAEYLPCLLSCISLPPVSLLVFSSPTRSSVSVIMCSCFVFPIAAVRHICGWEDIQLLVNPASGRSLTTSTHL